MAKEAVKEQKNSKQTTLAGFFGKPKAGPAPPSRPSSAASQTPAPRNGVKPLAASATQKSAPAPSSPASTSVLKAPSSLPKSSPVPNTDDRTKRAGSPLKQSFTVEDAESEDELSPPPDIIPTTTSRGAKVLSTSDTQEENESMEVDPESQSSEAGPSRRRKRKVVYAESNSGSSDDETLVPSTKGRRPRKSLKEDSDSDDFFVADDDDDDVMLAAAEEYEASVASSPSIRSISESPAPMPRKKATKSSAKSFVAPKVSKRPSSSSKPTRPSLMPNAGASSSRSAASANFLLTASERNRLEVEETKRESEKCFDFLKEENIRDKAGNPKGHPEYDGRTIKIPKKSWEEFSPFEAQFWRLKQDAFDTILFFQKGKFYELYEDDALIGHQEFDLKLTDRVKMKMVGVPEQSFEMWANKFLAAGYKVGKVVQSETAMGKEVRQKDAKVAGKKAGPVDAEDKIVRRELERVFTNGTVVDGAYLSTHEANHCVSIKEYCPDPHGPSAFGICFADTSTGAINLSYFQDDIIRTRLETLFRQIRPKELIAAKGNLTVATERLLRGILPMECRRQTFKDGTEFWSAEETLRKLTEMYETESDEPGSKEILPAEIAGLVDKPTAMEALGGMYFYLGSLHLDKDIFSQKNFNVYDPIREGDNLILDGLTLGHMEVLVNNEGGKEGTLLELLENCATPFGKRLFREWLQCPLRNAAGINDRLDAVEDIMNNPTFGGAFNNWASTVPDLERLVSRIHAGSVKQSDLLKVVDNFDTMNVMIVQLLDDAERFPSRSVSGLLRTAPDIEPLIKHIKSMYYTLDHERTIEILPTDGADPDVDRHKAGCNDLEEELDAILRKARKAIDCPQSKFWHSAQGGKDIYNIEVPIKTKVPHNWAKQSSTGKIARYLTPETIPKIRELQESRERLSMAKRAFFGNLLHEFDKDRPSWLKSIRVIAELDCLVSLAKASAAMDSPKCRPVFVDTPQAFVDFTELRHPSMCLRSSFIANDVQLGGDQPRQILLTGPNMAGKSTLLRMTAAGVIMAQLGCYVPAEKARLSPIDRIQTRMGAYDSMFSGASTFKVELDECSKILREAGPKSLIILDELGRGTSTYDGMAIAGAVLHHVATHTLPLGFFATHYGSLTEDFAYHPNIRRMHMKTHVDDVQMAVVFLYKLIAGVAESSHGTHVAHMAGVPGSVVTRAQAVSEDFFKAFKAKLDARRKSSLPLTAHGDFAYLMKVALNKGGESESAIVRGGGGRKATVGEQLDMIRACIGKYETA